MRLLIIDIVLCVSVNLRIKALLQPYVSYYDAIQLLINKLFDSCSFINVLQFP